MPNRDGTGPLGNGPIRPRQGRGQGRRKMMKFNSSKNCTCPKCGYEMPAQRGIPCSEIECPKCSSKMKGKNCLNNSEVSE